jgi:hypothetical protein
MGKVDSVICVWYNKDGRLTALDAGGMDGDMRA